LELSDKERLLNGLVTDAPRQLNNTIEGDARPVCQGVMIAFVWFQPVSDLSTKGVEQSTT